MEEILHKEKTHSEHVLGVSALTLIFFAGVFFSWSFFSDVSKPVDVADALGPADGAQSAEAATALASLQWGYATSTTADAFASLSIFAKSAIVIDLTERTILYELNPDTQLPLASLTKVPLVLVVAQNLSPGEILTMPEGIPQFSAGTQWKLSDIIDYTLAISSNQGADVLAAAANAEIRSHYPEAPEHEAALWRMNQLARELGLSHTYFLNNNGLDESPTQAGAYGTARDMAILFAEAASTSSETFAATKRQTFSIESLEGARATAINTDTALPSIPGLIMGKTGYTTLAGGNLAVVYESGGHRIVSVVLGSTQAGRFDDMKALIDRTSQAMNTER